ncbi:sugar phosphate isomerase/epimerase family protein [Lacihabitans soyangensis]|uniref:Sugar phosphate isomerase/epimerase n=1 Tax=Lacihabitans soyangensis TaxID=869394 RepID=A0AAE3KR86_9BACT|nr:sugar phosphate isomerase/epimerase family protein [Lacihabitans soyangensis]MCP9761873.1 sugar phosphate isomerase/epimerase [Lacihabitans soyangensis]
MNRKKFLQTSLGILIGSQAFSKPKNKRKFCFNTLACPDWSLQEVLTNAQKYGYKAVEIRGIKGDVDILNSPEFAPSRITDIRKMSEDYGVKILNLNSSVVLHEYEPEKRTKNLETAKRYIDLAQHLDCPYVRVFPDKFPKEKSKEFALDTIKSNYEKLIDYCKGSKVKVLLDAHGDLVWSEDLLKMMQGLDKKHVGIIWDFFNMHLITKESPQKMYETLKSYIKIVQIKDGFFKPNNTYEYTLTGKGEVPINEILRIIEKDNYKGFISFEWEKRWHPELPNPEVALPSFVEYIQKQF